jgi:hypothetical protein
MALGDIRTYDSFDEMLADQRQAEEAANSRVIPLQETITFGDYVINLSSIAESGPVYGRLQTEEESAALHREYYERRPDDLAEDGYATVEEAIAGAWEPIAEQRTRGYIWGTWFSPMFPEGELGSAHISVCIPISKEVYDDAREHDGSVSEDHAAEVEAIWKEANRQHQALMSAKSAEPIGEGDVNTDG